MPVSQWLRVVGSAWLLYAGIGAAMELPARLAPVAGAAVAEGCATAIMLGAMYPALRVVLGPGTAWPRYLILAGLVVLARMLTAWLVKP